VETKLSPFYREQALYGAITVDDIVTSIAASRWPTVV